MLHIFQEEFCPKLSDHVCVHHTHAFTAAVGGTFFLLLLLLFICCLCYKICVWKRKVDRHEFVDSVRRREEEKRQKEEEKQQKEEEKRQKEEEEKQKWCRNNSAKPFVGAKKTSRISQRTEEEEEEIPLDSFSSRDYAEPSLASIMDESTMVEIDLDK